MRKNVLVSGLLILSIGLASLGAAGTLAPEVESTAPTRIIASALGPSPLEENLRQLTDEVGGRMSGSPSMRRAVAWAMEAFRQAGVDDVHTETFSMPVGWSEGDTRLEILEPVSFQPGVVSLGWSPPADLEAPVVLVGQGTDADFAGVGTQARGAILLVESDLLDTWEDLFGEYMRAPGIIDRALDAGAKAILWMSTRKHRLLYRHQNVITGDVDQIPQGLIAREDAQRIARLLRSRQGVRARLTMPNRISGPLEEENIVAEIRGREKPEEIVVLGAHLDSWDLGTGALDDGCNSALVIDVARALRAAGRPPRRTVRFVLFSGEEQGMHGSRAYVQAHPEEMDNTVAAVIYDAGIGRVTGYSLGGRKDVEAAVRGILQPVESWGANEHTIDAGVGTDNLDFLLEGIPTLVANQEPANYMVNYHAASDTFDKVDIRDLKLHTALAAVTVWGIAERPERLGERQSRQEIEVLMRETGLDRQLKLFELWEQWERGERGRQP